MLTVKKTALPVVIEESPSTAATDDDGRGKRYHSYLVGYNAVSADAFCTLYKNRKALALAT